MLFKNWCRFYHDKMNPKCLPVADKIRSIYEKDGSIDPIIFTKYLNHLNSHPYCMQLIEHRNMVYDLIKILVPTNEDIKLILSIYRPDYDHKYKPVINELFKILQDLIDRKIITHNVVKYTLAQYNMKEISAFLLKHIPADIELVELACLHGNIESFPLMLGQKIKTTTKSLENILNYYSTHPNEKINKMEIMTLLLKYGAEPDFNCLIKACLIKDKEILNKILSYKIKPTTECFKNLITPPPYSYSKSKYSRRSNYSQTTENQENVAETIDILITHGYTLTKEDVTDALENEYYINGIQRFNFNFDEKLLEKCYQKNYFPYKDLNLKPNIQCLREACNKKGNLKLIKQLVKEGIEPDIECLRNACGFRSGNVPVIRYLVENKKIKPDIECIKQISRTINNGTLEYLFKQYDPTYDQNYNSDNESDNEENKKQVADIESESEDDEPVKTKQILEDSDSESEDVKPTKKAIKAKPEPISEDDSISDEQMEDSEDQIYTIADYKKKGYKLAKLNKMIDVDKRKKYSLTDDAYKLFGIKSATKFKLYAIRKKLNDYVATNNLADKKIKNLVKPNESLQKLLNVKADEYINIDDKIVSLMIKHI